MTFRRPPAAWLPDAAFFAGFLAYAIFGIDTRLVYHWQTPSFYVTYEFLASFLHYPGGPADWLYLLGAQAYPSRVGGAILLTAGAAAVTVLAGRCCRALPLLRFFPALLLAYTWSLYYDRTPLGIAMLVGLGSGVALLNSKGRPLWLALLLIAATYSIGGTVAVAVFGAAAAGMLVTSRQYGKALAVAGLAAALPAGARLARIAAAPVPNTAVLGAVCVFAAAAGLLSVGRARGWRWLPAVALAGLGAVTVYSYRANDRDRRLAALDYYTSHERWADVIAAGAKLRPDDFNSLTRYEVNLALHETGRLGDEMFRFPQSESMLPPLRAEAFLPYMLRVTDLLLRLGRLNDAEHFGNEAMVLGDSDPRVLKLLADVEIAKGQTVAARKYLTALASEVHAAGWARERLRDSGPVDRVRRRATQSDDFIDVWQNPNKPGADIDRLLAAQLEADPTNRMAFEFLMGNYLLARNLTAARELMPRIRQMSGPAYEGRTPRHYQEAMAMFSDATGQRVEIPGFAIEPDTWNRMAVFKRLLAQSAGRDAALRAAWDRFRDTYFFFYVFGPGDYR